jgi:hypothetical protein
MPDYEAILHKLREPGLKIPSELDYSLDYAHGSIHSSFLCSFFVIHGRTSDSRETVEIEKVCFDCLFVTYLIGGCHDGSNDPMNYSMLVISRYVSVV